MAGAVRLETLLGRMVVDDEGRCVGHIEEIVARRSGHALTVVEFRLGDHGLLRRLAQGAFGHALLGIVPFVRHTVYRVPWDRMDLSDPGRPRLTGTREDLETAA
jgi:sporulation protein YlmC with PRC-barrel domain